MSTALAVALYFMIWWITLFAVLPFGVKTQEEDGEILEGTPRSAPATPRIARVMVINTIVASIAFSVVWLALDRDWLGLRIPDGMGVPAGVTQ